MTEPWLERWQEGRTGWHEEGGSASLREFWPVTGHTVLVPLCGKAVDMRWLAEQGNRVIGVELSDLAIKAFFDEQGLQYQVTDGRLVRYDAVSLDISIFCGDFFELTEIRCDAHFDRGALVALPQAMRPAYAAHVSKLLSADATQVVVTLDYDDSVANGPPFSVPDEELLSYWPSLQLVDAHDDFRNAPPKFVNAGLTEIIQKTWRST